MNSVAQNQEVTVLSVDDNPLMGDTVERWYKDRPGYRYAGHCLSGAGVIDKIKACGISVVVMDLDIPGTDTCGLVAEITDACPGCRVMMLSGHCRGNEILDCLASGAKGYVLKFRAPAYIQEAIDKVARGEPFLCDEAARTAGLA